MSGLRRRWLRFGLRTLFLVTTIACVALWLGREMQLVHERQALRDHLRAKKENVFVAKDWPDISTTPIQVSRLRRWMGDEAVVAINLPPGSTEADVDNARKIFPEAVSIRVRTDTYRGGGFF